LGFLTKAVSEQRHRSFAPIYGPETRLMILGSLPGARSLAASQYYAHPQNQFWRLLGGVMGHDLAASDYSQRLALLRQYHIGLWDVIESASRRSSLDSDIKEAAPQDLLGLIAALPNLRAIGFNGGKAAQLGRRILAGKGEPARGPSRPDLHLIDLPSSSAANTRSFASKAEAWAALAPYVGGA
jgi:TDG/mug DNA glycosylase family protein